MSKDARVDDYIAGLADWQQRICSNVRQMIHDAEPEIEETIKFTNRPYFTLKGNVCALLAAKDHVNVFVYDPIAPDPAGLINQGHGNATARSIQIKPGESIDSAAFKALVKTVASNNRAGGWRKVTRG
jgi:hypothetical protein